MTKSDWAIGFDIGGTKIEASLIDSEGNLDATLRDSTPETASETASLIAEMVAQLTRRRTICGIGFGIPGSLDGDGVLRNAPNSPGIEGTRFRDDMMRLIPYPMAFENDANCLVMAESKFGKAKGMDFVVGVILGTGIGVGAILDGKLFRGAHGWAPEPGHLPLDIRGRTCRCGLKGCVEAYLSGPSLLKRFRELGGPLEMDSEDLFESQDPIATELLDQTRELYLRFLGMLTSIFDPQILVLGGGLSNQPLFVEDIEGQIPSHSFGSDRAPRLVRSSLGSEAGKFGAAAIVLGGCS